MEKGGSSGTAVRTFIQSKMSISDAEYAPIHEAADRLSSAMADLNTKAIHLRQLYLQTKPVKGAPLTPEQQTLYDQLKQIDTDREQMLTQQMEELDNELSSNARSTFRKFLVSRIAPNTKAIPSSNSAQTPASGSTADVNSITPDSVTRPIPAIPNTPDGSYETSNNIPGAEAFAFIGAGEEQYPSSGSSGLPERGPRTATGEVEAYIEMDNLDTADVDYVAGAGYLFVNGSTVASLPAVYGLESAVSTVSVSPTNNTFTFEPQVDACYLVDITEVPPPTPLPPGCDTDDCGDPEPEYVQAQSTPEPSPLFSEGPPSTYPTATICQPYNGSDISVTVGIPQITSVTPPSANIGTSGSFTVQGVNLEDEEGTSISDLPGIPTSVSSPGASNETVSYSIPSTQTMGNYQFTISNMWGTSNAVNFTVGAPGAVIASLSSYTWTAGTSFTLIITGTGFGNQPTVSISGAGVTSSAATNTSPDGTQTQVTVTVAQDAPNESATVQVQPGYAGNSYVCGNCNGGSPVGTSAASVNAVTPTPQIMFNGSNISGTTQTVVAGQQIVLSVPTPNGYSIQSQSWSFSNQSAITGGFVDGAGTPGTQPSASAGGTEASDPSLNQNSLTFYWVNPGDNGETVTYNYTLNNGQSASATATFNIGGPTGSLFPNAFAQSNNTGSVLSNAQSSVAALSMTNAPIHPTNGSVGVFLTDNAQPVSNQSQCPTSPGAPPAAGCGQFIWVQILNSVTQLQIVPQNSTFTPFTASNQLDGTYPYFNGPGYANATWDSPGRGIESTWGEAAEPFNATMYVLWDPALPAGCTPAWTDTSSVPYIDHASTCTSTPIPLGSVHWNWSACTINAGTGAAPNWFLQCGTGSGNTAGAASGYPQWTTGTGSGGCSVSANTNCQ
ncbi:hypothetical protein GCM10011507_26370 [Edaphobacter acidisoli]|uniref:Uncharacterized protein n=2 Tax=Edaphobacter acidisoli TaxID=2040573 RepID=A0A916RX63_9BACT|nr:hypothetical protein GCM10011507_26370 [Edaphobacter acidisoli]